MDSAAVQYDILAQLLPAILFTVVAIVVAAVGIMRWRPTVATLAIVSLALLVVGSILYRNPILDATAPQPTPLATDTGSSTAQIMGLSAQHSSIILGSLCAFFALIVAARGRQFGWFAGIAVASIISGLAGLLLLMPTLVFDFTSQEQAQSIITTSNVPLIAAVLAGFVALVELLYALIGQTVAGVTLTTNDDITMP